MSDNPILQVRDLRKQFSRTTAVDGLSFSINKGEIFALLGPNGAGKSTTLRMLLDIIRPDSGTISYKIEGSIRTKVGYLPEDRGLYPDLPILRTLIYFGQLHGMTTAEARRSAIDWLKRADLADRANDKLLTLSKGNQQKIQFISAIIHQPLFAILDEPFSGLDPINQEKFIDTIRELKQNGTTILLSSHQMALVEKLADRILLMNQGKSLFCGTLPEIRHQSVTEGKIMVRFEDQPDHSILETTEGLTNVQYTDDGETIIEFDRMSSLNQMMSRLARLSTIVSVRSSRTDLHDIYLQMTLASKKHRTP